MVYELLSEVAARVDLICEETPNAFNFEEFVFERYADSIVGETVKTPVGETGKRGLFLIPRNSTELAGCLEYYTVVFKRNLYDSNVECVPPL